jgi:hypothetical protein
MRTQPIVDDELAKIPPKVNGGQGPEVDAATPELQKTIRDIILNRDVPPFDKRRLIRDLVKREFLSSRKGFLCQTADERAFYFHKGERRLYDLEQRAFQHLLASVSGLSATETQFRFVLDSFQTEAARTKPVDVHTLARFEVQTGTLHISDGGGGVWRRERRGKWEFCDNGDGGILFLTESDAQPWTPEFKRDRALPWLLSHFLVDDGNGLSYEEQKTLLMVWFQQNFFPALRRTRIIPAFLGPQGTGKTSAMRMIGILFCGPDFDVTGLCRDREDAFVAAVSNRVVVALDNADSRIQWLEDALATYATGLRYRLRRLYTTNEEVSYQPRASLLLSSRDPHFRRPDVAERLLPLHFKRPDAYQPESVLFGGLMERRGQIMGELLSRAGSIADSLAGVNLPALQFRMADFASFGWAVSRSAGQEGEWESLLSKLERAQMEFASEGDSLVIVLRNILDAEGRIGPVDAGELYRRCSPLAESQSLPFAKSAQGFGLSGRRARLPLEFRLAGRGKERGTVGSHRRSSWVVRLPGAPALSVSKYFVVVLGCAEFLVWQAGQLVVRLGRRRASPKTPQNDS